MYEAIPIKSKGDIINELFKVSENSRSLVVLFPGGNYGCDKPLLYYARKAAANLGFDVLNIAYSKKLSAEDVGMESLDIIADEVNCTIKSATLKEYDNIYFISKSIGTEIAGNISERLEYGNVKNLFLTPTRGSIKYILKSECMIVTGTKDKLFTDDCIDLIKKIKHVDLILVKGGNHSLEIEDNVEQSINIMQDIAKLYTIFLKD